MEKETKLIYHPLLVNHNPLSQIGVCYYTGTNFNSSKIQTVERSLRLIPSGFFSKAITKKSHIKQLYLLFGFLENTQNSLFLLSAFNIYSLTGMNPPQHHYATYNTRDMEMKI